MLWNVKPRTDKRYFDTYANSSFSPTYNMRILGDATGEMGPFFPENEISINIYIHFHACYNKVKKEIERSVPYG